MDEEQSKCTTASARSSLSVSAAEYGTIATARSSMSASAVEHGTIATARRVPIRIVQNFLLIWLDSHVDESNDDCRNSITQLRHIFNTINTFSDADQCIDFLTKIQHEKAFMIVSGALGQHMLPLIHDVPQLDSVYVLWENESSHEQWVKDWSKLKGAFTQIAPICDLLKQAVRQCDQDSISVSFVSATEASNRNFDQLDQSFMYTQILKEILLEIEYNEQSIKELAAYCRDHYLENPRELLIIDKFQREYHHQSPIWWYTYECFIYHMLNRALRTQEVDTIIKMGFFVRDLHRHIEQLHSEQFGDHLGRSFTVYRGQGMSMADFEKMLRAKGGLMSFNNFLSTSKKLEVSMNFACRALTNPESMGILFTITIDPSISSTPFALIDNVSYYNESENEILFSMHGVFRISEIKQIDNNNRLWRVELTLTDDNDPHLSALTEQMRDETVRGSKGWIRLGLLLIKLGESEKAEELYRALFDQAHNDEEKAHLYHQFGLIKYNQGVYVEAIRFYEEALEVLQRTLPPNHPSLAVSYNNIGTVYNNMGEYSKALSFYEKALLIYQRTLPLNLLWFAASYNNIGMVYKGMGEYSKALSFYEKALEIYQKRLPSNHPDLTNSYNNIASVYSKLGEYSKALSSHEKALGIEQTTLPPNHPDLATSYCHIGLTYSKLREYSKALSSHEKALEIRQKSLAPNHPDLATSYSSIGLVYYNINEYSKALSFQEKALEIRQKALPLNHPSLATSYNNIGAMYSSTHEYSKALSFYEKALEIFQTILPSNHPDLAASYNNIGTVYNSTHEYSKALSFYEKAHEIDQKTLPPKHPLLGASYNNIGMVYSELGEYAKAFSFLEKALEIEQHSLSKSHPDLQKLRKNLSFVRKKL